MLNESEARDLQNRINDLIDATDNLRDAEKNRAEARYSLNKWICDHVRLSRGGK